MPEQILASDLDEQHVGRRVHHKLFWGTLLAAEHGGPFPVPDGLSGAEPPFAEDGTIPRAFTTQLHVRPILPGYPMPEDNQHGSPDAFYVWLVPGEVVTIEESDHA